MTADSRLATAGDIDAAIQAILRRKGVLGYIILGANDSVLQTNFEGETAQKYASLLPALSYLSQNFVRDLDPQDDMEILRIRSQKREIMMSLRPDYMLAVVQSITPAITK